ncbi:MAG TPA: hypothetical protein VG674_30555 [Amycolatopsis sp.]|nr:hypothetical protein [Amycolatopsis sp.]
MRTVAAARVVLGVATAAGLAVDAWVHFDLASTYDRVGSAITEGALFRAQAAAALLACVIVLRWRGVRSFAFALLVASTALLALIAATYLRIGAIGPFPDMSEPTWFPEKARAAIGEAVALFAAASGVVTGLLHRRRR